MWSMMNKKLRVIRKAVSFLPFSMRDGYFSHKSYEVEKIAIPFCFSLFT
jgi:hypothetical protein